MSLTAAEIKKKEYLASQADQWEKEQPCENLNAIDAFELKFHYIMQHPNEAGDITFTDIPKRMILFSYLADYFSENGTSLFEKSIRQLDLSNISLKGYNHNNAYWGIWDEMGDATPSIALLIRKNPDIQIIDLSNTQIGDAEANALLKALKYNNKLTALKLDGNTISPALLDKINQHFEKKGQVEKASCRIM